MTTKRTRNTVTGGADLIVSRITWVRQAAERYAAAQLAEADALAAQRSAEEKVARCGLARNEAARDEAGARDALVAAAKGKVLMRRDRFGESETSTPWTPSWVAQ